jgi:hypothetical protein
MFDTIDGLKAGTLKDVDTTTSDNTAVVNPWCKNPTLCPTLRNNTPYCCDNCIRKQMWEAAKKKKGLTWNPL